MQHLIIIDGLNFFFRAYHAVRPLNRSDGLPTNALYGFTQMLLKVVKDLKPDLCAVALDSKGDTFRSELYPEYKANRKEVDEEMLQQFPYFDPLIRSFDIPEIRMEGFEADDIIASLVAQHKDTHKITIVSSDKDLMQLIGDNVTMYDTMKPAPDGSKGQEISYAEVEKKFNVTPDKVIEVQALIGDSSDNIPGVPSIGPKNAATLINEFGSVDELYRRLDEDPACIAREKLRQTLLENREQALLSKQLVTLKNDLEVPTSLDSLVYTPDLTKTVEFLKTLEFDSLAKRLVANGAKPAPATPSANEVTTSGYQTISTLDQLQTWIAKIKSAKLCAIDTETSMLDAMQADLVGISLAVEEGSGAYIPLAHDGGDMFSTDNTPQIPIQEALAALRPILADKNIVKVGQNLKYDLHILHRYDVEMLNIEDTMLLSFVLHGGKHSHGMDELAERYLDHQCIKFKDVCGTGKKQLTFNQVDIATATKYAAEDADITLRLYNLFKPQLELPANKLLKNVYEKIELPLVPTLTRMEEHGVLLDSQALQKLSQEFSQQLAIHEKEIFALAGQEFNIDSPKQLGEILFDRLALKVKGKNGKRSTNVTVLEELAEQGHKIAEHILEYRGLAKLRSTYTEALIKQINPQTGRIHTSYHQAGAATGRFSSSDPNLQNIPARSENGRKIRAAFVAPQGSVLLRCDYSQIELRLLAHVSNSHTLQEAFISGADIHTFTASQIFDVPLDKVDKIQRNTAKTINFGLVYGMGSTALAKNIGVSRAEAKQYIDDYFARYDNVKACLDGYIEFAQEHGYVETIYGRRVHVPNINSSHPMLRTGSERAAINAPLQGANADIIKLVMPVIEQKLLDKGLTAKMLMQVHDELIFEVPENELAEAEKIIVHEMENVVKLSIPLKVEAQSAQCW